MIEPYNYNDELSGRVDTLALALDKCERLEKQLIETKDTLTTALGKCNRLEKELIKAKNILADLTFSAPCDSILHCQIKEKAERFFKEIENENRVFAYMGKPVDALTYIEKKIEHERKELEKC